MITFNKLKISILHFLKFSNHIEIDWSLTYKKVRIKDEEKLISISRKTQNEESKYWNREHFIVFKNKLLSKFKDDSHYI